MRRSTRLAHERASRNTTLPPVQTNTDTLTLPMAYATLASRYCHLVPLYALRLAMGGTRSSQDTALASRGQGYYLTEPERAVCR